jgi:CHAD domain-containing protein
LRDTCIREFTYRADALGAHFVVFQGVAYRLKRKESISHGLRRLADAELGSAAACLQSRNPRDRDEAVHEGRKSIKKTRALLDLARADLGREYEQARDRLRLAARPLSQERDAAILIETLEALHKKHRETLHPQTWAAIRRALETAAAEAVSRALRPASITRMLNALARVRDDTRSWSFDAKGFRALRPGLKRCFARARKALRRAQEDPTPDSLHRWRKRVKTHWYHVRLVEATKPRTLDLYLAKLHDLEAWLGDHHNLVVLDKRLEATRWPRSMDEDVTRLLAILERRKARIQDRAFSLGARIYAERTSTFVRRLKHYWHTWRH